MDKKEFNRVVKEVFTQYGFKKKCERYFLIFDDIMISCQLYTWNGVRGEFTSGYIGGAVSGLVQGIAGLSGPLGTTLGGSVGSGLGTLITGALDNLWGSEDMKKSSAQIWGNAAVSFTVALGTSSLTGFVDASVRMGVPSRAYGLMPGLTDTFGKMITSFFGAIDDAITYIVIMGGV